MNKPHLYLVTPNTKLQEAARAGTNCHQLVEQTINALMQLTPDARVYVVNCFCEQCGKFDPEDKCKCFLDGI